MARPNDRMRLKDKIIDNISKAIKSIQELHYYHQKDPVLAGSCDTVTLQNGDRPCHKLCENMDHALLHGLKHVTHGYWRVVKQLSHKGMVKEIDLLTNVTTDLGRGRAWLYVSLNEGLLESYIKLLGENEKLCKKYYAKEALVLDHDRMNLLLTLVSGLECAVFRLEYDLPYLDLSAYPPRSRTDSELDGDVGSPGQTYLSSLRIRCGLEVGVDSPDSTTRLPSDSDSSSLASVDVLSQFEQGHHMRVSTISSDSGYPAENGFSNLIKQRSVTPTDVIVSSHQINGITNDTVSLSSVNSLGEPDRHQRLENIVPAVEEEEDTGSNSLEVIRIKSKKGVKSKKKKLNVKEKDSTEKSSHQIGQKVSKTATRHKNECSDDQDNVIHTDINAVQKKREKTGTKSDVENTTIVQTNTDLSASSTTSENTTPDEEDVGGSSVLYKAPPTTIPQYDSGVDICALTSCEGRPLPSVTGDLTSSPMVTVKDEPGEDSSVPSQSKSALAQIESKIAELCSLDVIDHDSSQKNSKPSLHDTEKPENEDTNSKEIAPDASQLKTYGSSLQPSNGARGLTSVSHNSLSHFTLPSPSTSSSHPVTDGGSVYSDFDGKAQQWSEKERKDGRDTKNKKSIDLADNHDEDFDVYAGQSSEKEMRQGNSESQLGEASVEISKAQAASKLQDYMDFILQSNESPPAAPEKQESYEEEVDYSLNLDNNTKLQVMLDIFTHEDEQFVKMFVTRDNHTEGEAGVVFVLISDKSLYLLHYKRATRKFKLHSSAMLTDLIFISTGLFDQTLNLESRGKAKQKQRLWLTPGHQALTQAIVSCLTETVKTANEHMVTVRSRFSVGTEVPLQKIALRKYISKELHCEAQDVSVEDYSLVFWEDPKAPSVQQQNSASKEGTLFLRTQDPLKGYLWKPVYIVLKNSMLTVSNSKTDLRPHSYLGLGGDQCVGCRLTTMGDRDNCVELVLAQGVSWYLSAASRPEITDWMHQLCLAVSQGTVDDSVLTACMPCCAVLSCNKLFLCHEDLHTKFYRTLGRAQLEDVTAVSIDEEDPTYCVIEFESVEVGVSSEQWVFYFASAQDLDRHKLALSETWKEIYQIELPIFPLDNVALQTQCRAHSELLKKQLTNR